MALPLNDSFNLRPHYYTDQQLIDCYLELPPGKIPIPLWNQIEDITRDRDKYSPTRPMTVMRSQFSVRAQPRPIGRQKRVEPIQFAFSPSVQLQLPLKNVQKTLKNYVNQPTAPGLNASKVSDPESLQTIAANHEPNVGGIHETGFLLSCLLHVYTSSYRLSSCKKELIKQRSRANHD